MIDLWRVPTARSLLMWVSALETPGELVMACADAPACVAGKHDIYVVFDACLAGQGSGGTDGKPVVSAALPALMASLGVRGVRVARCDACAQGHSELYVLWQALYGSFVQVQAPGVLPGQVKKSYFRGRKASPLHVDAIPLPRRYALGLQDVHSLPFDIDADEVERFIQVVTKNPDILHHHNADVTPPHDTGDTHGKAAGGQPPSAIRKLPLWGLNLQVEGCTACGVCEKACPGGALSLVPGQSVHNLVHDLRKCRSCATCVALCPPKVLKAQGTWLGEVLPAVTHGQRQLCEVRTHPCPLCGFTVPGDGDDLCEYCAYRQENPFGFRLPPGVTLEDLKARRQPS